MRRRASHKAASAATSWRASPRRRPVGCSARNACPIIPLARAWSAARAPAGSGISTAGNSTWAIMSAFRIAPDAKVMLKHGAGGRAMRELIQQVFVGDARPPADGGIGLAAMDDGAAIRAGDQWLVMTTDSYVIKPA